MHGSVYGNVYTVSFVFDLNKRVRKKCECECMYKYLRIY